MKKLTLEEKIKCLEFAYENCYYFTTDKLDCSISVSRQPVKLTFREIMKYFNDKSFFFCGIKEDFLTKEKYYDVGFRTEYNYKSVEVFLWLNVKTEIMEIFLTK